MWWYLSVGYRVAREFVQLLLESQGATGVHGS
jgi:hypothetical protein